MTGRSLTVTVLSPVSRQQWDALVQPPSLRPPSATLRTADRSPLQSRSQAESAARAAVLTVQAEATGNARTSPVNSPDVAYAVVRARRPAVASTVDQPRNLRVGASSRPVQHLGVRTTLHHSAHLEHHDLARIDHRAQQVGVEGGVDGMATRVAGSSKQGRDSVSETERHLMPGHRGVRHMESSHCATT